MRTARLFNYDKRLPEALPRGGVYFAGETILKYGNFNAVIAPYRTAEGLEVEWGEVVALDSNGKIRRVTGSDTADDFIGIVHRNATVTYHVLDKQDMGLPLGQNVSVWLGKRQGQIAVPVQNIYTYDGSGDVATTVLPVNGGKVYVRVAESTANPDLPIGGIETVDIDGETVEWTGVKFTTGIMAPYGGDAKYTDSDSPTQMVAGIEL